MLFNTNFACLAQAMATCKKWHHVSFAKAHGGTKLQRNCNDKKIPTTWHLVGLLKVYEPKLSSMLALRVELKERKCEICWFKLRSSKLAITSSTRSDLSAISKRTLTCSSPRTFGISKRGGRRLSGCTVTCWET